jgi:uncharacterized protein YbjT (DUF2867 family)
MSEMRAVHLKGSARAISLQRLTVVGEFGTIAPIEKWLRNGLPHWLNLEPLPSMLPSWDEWRRRILSQAEVHFVNQDFAAMILGGTGQVGGAAVAGLLAIPECRGVVMVTRKPIAPQSRVRNVVLDTGAADFAERTAAVAREVLSQGPASAVSCVGVGSGSARWSEEELKRLEVGVVGAFARGCHDAGIAQFCLLSAVGSSARSRFRYARVMGMKEDTVRNIGFTRLAIFRPGIIVGNAHTPAWVGWLGSVVPGPFGNIDQRILGRSIAAEIALRSREAGEVIRENAAMKKLAAPFNSVP